MPSTRYTEAYRKTSVIRMHRREYAGDFELAPRTKQSQGTDSCSGCRKLCLLTFCPQSYTFLTLRIIKIAKNRTVLDSASGTV